MPRLREFWVTQWGSEIMIAHGEVIQYAQVEGFVLGDWAGVITFMIRDDECEITSINSLHEGRGVGTKLLNEVINESKNRKCRRVFLITTNDNLNAMGFYQKRGFKFSALRRGAVNDSRKLKPSIPLTGMHNIPLRDELELEMMI